MKNFKRAGAMVELVDGNVAQLGETVIKGIRDGWIYFAHLENGECRMVKRTEFRYLQKNRKKKKPTISY